MRKKCIGFLDYGRPCPFLAVEGRNYCHRHGPTSSPITVAKKAAPKSSRKAIKAKTTIKKKMR